MNGLGQYKSYKLGNGKTSINTYHHGIPTNYSTPAVQNLSMAWNYTNGNLNSRTDGLKSKTESFTYDNLDRLKGSSGIGIATTSMVYEPNGNISQKSDAGTYDYHSAKFNAVDYISGSQNIPSFSQNITYTSYAHPNLITESTNRLEYTYGVDEQRIKAITKVNNTISNTRYYFGDYEKDITNGVTKHIYYISAGDGLIAIAIRENNINTFHYAYTDHLGSIVALTDNAGTITSEQNFDACLSVHNKVKAEGRRRNPTNWTYASIPAVQIWLKRGYTGHSLVPIFIGKHLSQFGLINMNGRMYDPVVGRMLSTDNFVQSPDNTQSYNRYSYALNNPLKYTDPSGEFVIIDSYLRGLFKGGFKEANRFAGNDAKIWAGLYVSDNNKTFFGQVLEIASRLTYQLPQTVGGLITAHVSNTILGNVNFVRYEHGATVVQTSQKNTGSAVTQGSYIVGGSKLEADANNPLFQHEYGHYLQSQSMGWAYYPRIGIPSLLSASGSGNHDFNKVEQDANRRAFLYFNTLMSGKKRF